LPICELVNDRQFCALLYVQSAQSSLHGEINQITRFDSIFCKNLGIIAKNRFNQGHFYWLFSYLVESAMYRRPWNFLNIGIRLLALL